MQNNLKKTFNVMDNNKLNESKLKMAESKT